MYNAGTVLHLLLTCDEIHSVTEVLVATSWSRTTFGKMTVGNVVKNSALKWIPKYQYHLYINYQLLCTDYYLFIKY